jgi:hypothetical protein
VTLGPAGNRAKTGVRAALSHDRQRKPTVLGEILPESKPGPFFSVAGRVG